MIRHQRTPCFLLALAFCFAAANPNLARAGDPPKAKDLTKEPMKVGMADTMVVGVPEVMVSILGDRLGAMMKEFTGLGADLDVGGDPFTLARKLDRGELELALFQGIEFAWVRAKHPSLRPLMLIVNKDRKVHSQVVVRTDARIASMADLHGKDIACPTKNKAHCQLFLESSCSKNGSGDPKSYFGKVVNPSSTEKALDALAAGEVQAVIACKTEIDFYNRVKPGSAAALKVLATSEEFPTAVIAFRQGSLAEPVLNRIRTGMFKANKSERGQDLLAAWHLTAFEPVSADYQRRLEDIIRSYPAPETRLSFRR